MSLPMSRLRVKGDPITMRMKEYEPKVCLRAVGWSDKRRLCRSDVCLVCLSHASRIAF